MPFLRTLLQVPAIVMLSASAALAGVEHRKSDLTVVVRSVDGKELQGATVAVEMLNHAFRFGTAVTAAKLEPGHPEYDEWTATEVDRYFNSVTFGNVMKWSYYEARTPERMLEILGFARAHRGFGSTDPMRVRGHVTVWGSAYQVPKDVRDSNDGVYIHNRIINHVWDYHTTFRDSGVDLFDLYNEPFHQTDLLIDKIVPSRDLAAQAAEIAQWFNTAKTADPNAVLYINEYNMLNFWSESDSDVKKYKALVDAIRDAGGQVDGIGLQAHMDRMITKEQIVRRLNILAAPMAPTANHPDGLPGLRLEVTELDINLSWNPTPQEQATVTANVLEGAFEHPSVDGITIWGMNDFHHWRKNAILFDDLDEATGNRITPVIKPSGQVWIGRVMKDWWTRASGETDSSGTFRTSVFKGKHRITVTSGGITREVISDITSATTVTVTVAATSSDARLLNLSTRALCQTGDNVLIPGFVISGTGTKRLLLRAAGPELLPMGVGTPLSDPQMVLKQGSAMLASNDNWGDPAEGGTNAAEIAAAAASVWAFPFDPGSASAALLVDLPAGTYTLVASGKANDTGVAIAEVYDIGGTSNDTRLVNISNRGYVGTGGNIMIPGFIVSEEGSRTFLIRAVGPTLGAEPFNVPGTLADPRLRIFRGSTNILSNDTWGENGDAADLRATSVALWAFPLLEGSTDAAFVVTLPPGAYTVQASGVDGTTGVALVEVYLVE